MEALREVPVENDSASDDSLGRLLSAKTIKGVAVSDSSGAMSYDGHV